MSVSLSKVCGGITASTTLRLNALVVELRAQGQDIIGLAAGEPDFDTPANIVAAANRAMEEGQTHYTAVSGIPSLRQAICDHLLKEKGLPYEKGNIIVGTGAKQVLYEALRAIVDPGDEVILPAPCWLSYAEMTCMCGGVPVIVDSRVEDGFEPDIADIAAKVTEKTKAILINSPNNPTGAVWSEKTLRQIAELAEEKDFWIISDEIYEKMVYDGSRHISIATMSDDARKRTILISGFSKAYAMTGWRLGYAAGDKSVIAAMDAYQSHATGNTNSIAQFAGVEALKGPQESVEKMVEAFGQRRELMLSCIRQIPGITCIEPKGAFYVLLDIEDCIGRVYEGKVITDDGVFAELLLQYAQVSVVPGGPFFAPGYVRLSYAVSEERILEAMRRIAQFVGDVMKQKSA